MVIPAATEIPTAFKEKRFLRIGSSKCNMKDYPKREIELFKILDGRTETIETVPAKYQELTFQNDTLLQEESVLFKQELISYFDLSLIHI